MPVAVTTAVPLGLSGRNAASASGSSSSNVARVSLKTRPVASKPMYQLMEVTNDMLPYFIAQQRHKDGKRRAEEEEQVQAGPSKRTQSLSIKGRNDDEAVLCTDDKTWQIRQMTQSNSLLLCTLATDESDSMPMTSGSSSLTVQTNVVEILELVPVVPRMGRIRSMLAASAYAGEEEDKRRTDGRFYTSQQVASVVQASPEELKEGLRQAHVVEMDGHCRMISSRYMTEALRALLAHLDAHALSPQAVPLREAVDAMMQRCEMRRVVAENILATFFGSWIESSEQDHEGKVALDAIAITRFIGLQLLEELAGGKPIPEADFMDKWSAAMGELGAHVESGLLKGNFLRHPTPPAVPTEMEPATVQYFDAAQLSLDAGARFQQLFRARPQWTLEDLDPFLGDVAIDGKRRDALLLKFARTSQVSVPIPETKQERKARKKRGEADKPPIRTVKLYSARLRY